MTKLDGTARGGILVALAAKHKLPVHFIGVGEGVEDLAPFAAKDFANAIAGIEMTAQHATPRRRTSCLNAKPKLNPLLKLALDMGPLILFFFANSRPALFLPFVGPLLPAAVAGEKAGIFVATAVFMVAILVALAVSYALTRHLPVMALVTAVIVVVFGRSRWCCTTTPSSR